MRALLLLVVVLLVSPAVAEERVWRLGVLNPGGWAESSLSQVMVPELARRDVVEGRNLIVLPYWGSGSDPAALCRAARTLAAADPDVVVAVSTEAVGRREWHHRALRSSRRSRNSVRDGVAKSLSRPGGMVTSIAMLAIEGDAKRVEVLHDAIPAARRIGLLIDRTHPSSTVDNVNRATANLGVEIISFEVQSKAEYRKAFDAMHDDELMVWSSPRPQCSLMTRRDLRRSPPSIDSPPFASGASWRLPVVSSATARTWPSSTCAPPTSSCAFSLVAIRPTYPSSSRRVSRWLS